MIVMKFIYFFFIILNFINCQNLKEKDSIILNSYIEKVINSSEFGYNDYPKNNIDQFLSDFHIIPNKQGSVILENLNSQKIIKIECNNLGQIKNIECNKKAVGWQLGLKYQFFNSGLLDYKYNQQNQLIREGNIINQYVNNSLVSSLSDELNIKFEKRDSCYNYERVHKDILSVKGVYCFNENKDLTYKSLKYYSLASKEKINDGKSSLLIFDSKTIFRSDKPFELTQTNKYKDSRIVESTITKNKNWVNSYDEFLTKTFTYSYNSYGLIDTVYVIDKIYSGGKTISKIFEYKIISKSPLKIEKYDVPIAPLELGEKVEIILNSFSFDSKGRLIQIIEYKDGKKPYTGKNIIYTE